MSSSEKGVSLSLYEKVKIKTTPTVLNGASTKHGLLVVVQVGYAGEGSTNYDPHLLGITEWAICSGKTMKRKLRSARKFEKVYGKFVSHSHRPLIIIFLPI